MTIAHTKPTPSIPLPPKVRFRQPGELAQIVRTLEPGESIWVGMHHAKCRTLVLTPKGWIKQHLSDRTFVVRIERDGSRIWRTK